MPFEDEADEAEAREAEERLRQALIDYRASLRLRTVRADDAEALGRMIRASDVVMWYLDGRNGPVPPKATSSRRRWAGKAPLDPI